MSSSSNQQKIDKIAQDIFKVNELIKNPYTTEKERKKYLKEREGLVKDAKKLGMPVPPLQLDETPLPTQDSSNDSYFTQIKNTAYTYYPFSSKKKNEQAEEEQLRQSQMYLAKMEQESRDRKAKQAAEAAEMDRKIRESMATSRIKNQRSAYEVEEEQRQIKESLEKDRELIERQRVEDEEMRRILAREQEDQLRRERDRVEQEQTQRSTELKNELSARNRHEEQLSYQTNLENQRKLQDLADRDMRTRESQQAEMLNLNASIAKEREEQQKELNRLDEEVRKVREESKRKYEELERKTREQMEMIMKLLERAQWSRAIEKNWEIRIKALKSTGRRAEHAISELRALLAQARFKEQSPLVIRKRMDQVKYELAEIVKVMDRESQNLEKMFEYSGKLFVKDVANSLTNISDICKEFTHYLTSNYQGSFQKPEASQLYERVDEYETQLSRAYRDIPTLSSLKIKYANDWENFESSSSSGAITDGSEEGHVIIIEEID